ncbi:MAG TPA: diphthine synthase [Candidatus Saccharimonadales bacterium]|nr:diphthine synthase [Candidatus Saccharimonadales bacterium]
MLYLIGLGLSQKDISLKGLQALKTADKIYIERYTLPISQEYVSFLESETQKKIVELKRRDLEDQRKATIADAANSTVAILVPGDPLVATTHHIILEAARELGIEMATYHAPSIFSVAIGESGLDIYKFGPTTTIPFWSAKYKPTSFIDVIKRNLENNQHTLVLLDVDPVEGKTMSSGDAIALLEKADERKGKGTITDKRKILIICEAGTAEQEILYTNMADTKIEKAQRRLEGKRTCLIIPAELSFAEEELVSAFKI